MPPQYQDQQPDEYSDSTRPLRRRRSNAPHRSAAREFYSDEHPEIPITRRASLRLDDISEQITQVAEEEDDTTLPSAPTTRKQHGLSRDSERMTALNRQRVSGRMPTVSNIGRQHDGQTARIPTTPPTRRPYDARHAREILRDNEPEQLRESDRIMVTQRHRQPIYNPPPAAHLGAHRRHPRTMLAYLQDISHHRAIIVTGTMLLVFLLLVPVGVTIALNISHIHSNTMLYSKNTDDKNATSTSSKGESIQPVDPYSMVITPEDTDHPPPPVFASSAYLLDANTGATLYAYNPFLHLPMLSTTKMMTAMLAVEKGKLDQPITINNQMAYDISQLAPDSSLMGIKKGETYTLRQLLYGLILVSGNDAATVIADAIAGSQQKFVAMMNQKAHDLGLYNTHYMNPHGLLATGHYSCAHDLALLGRDFMSIPLLHQISGTKTYEIPASSQHPEHMMINGDQFLWWYPGADGGKPGWDGAQDFLQVVSVTRNGHELIGVTMNTKDWWTDMRDLMNWGFDNFTWVSPYNADITHPPIPYDYEWNYFVSDKKTNTIPTADDGRYYIYTGFEISGLIMTYFDKHGGLNHFGYPIGMPQATGKAALQQKFEHGTVQCDLTSKQCKML
jgi:D-alanyl-D-alanine carboxypeptidase